MKRLEIRLSPNIEARLDALSDFSGLDRQGLFLAALASYHPEIKVEVKPQRKRKPRAEKTLGEGNKPKNVEEVVKFFKSKNIPEPIEPKAQLFFSYYEAKGWVMGKNPIKQWGQCLTSWIRNNSDWRPVISHPKESVSIDDFMDWASENRKPIFEKYRGTTDINEIDQLYIDEFCDNRDKN